MRKQYNRQERENKSLHGRTARENEWNREIITLKRKSQSTVRDEPEFYIQLGKPNKGYRDLYHLSGP